MKICQTSIANVFVVETTPFADHRGFFYRGFCDQELAPLLQDRVIRQVNVSRTESVGAIRGLHFQYPPHAEMKLVRCLRGRVWDVVLDLRRSSPTFLRWHSEELSAENARMMVIPEGCAHGFQVLEAGSELLYLHTATYMPESEGGVRFDDPALAIPWPLPIADISRRDGLHAPLTEDFTGIAL